MSSEEKKEIPSLLNFVETYMAMKFPMNWHHRLFYEILENKVYQSKQDNLLHINYHYLKGKHENKNILVIAPRFHAKCLPEDTLVVLNNGDTKKIQEIEIGEKLYSYKGQAIVNGKIKTGIKDILSISIEGGYKINCSKEHKILTFDGWKMAKNITTDDFVSVISKIDFKTNNKIDSDIVRFLGYMIADGCLVGNNCSFTNSDEIIINDFKRICKKLGFKYYQKGTTYHISGGSRKLLREFGLYNHNAKTKRIPPEVFNLKDELIAEMLSVIWDCDGYIARQSKTIGITLANEELIDDIRRLLLRLGIVSKKLYKKVSLKGKYFDAWSLGISNNNDIQLFRKKIKLLKKQNFVESIPLKKWDRSDYVPNGWKKLLTVSPYFLRKNYSIRIDNHYKSSREKVTRIAEITNNIKIKQLLSKPIIWRRVLGKKNSGKKMTYDIQTSTASFIVDGIVTHNSQCFTINYPIWEIYKNPNVRIIIVSANEDIAISFNRAIINHLENNQKLIEDLGYLVPQYPKKWGERAMIVKRDTMEKDPTIVAIGAGGKLISRRADIIIADDLLDINNARTKAMRTKTKEWFENVLIPILEDRGRLVVVGTSWYKEDLYDQLLKDSKFDIRLKLKALIYSQAFLEYLARGKKTQRKLSEFIPYKVTDFPMALKMEDIFAEDLYRKYGLKKKLVGGVLWKDKWDFEKLMKKKENMANSSFVRQYLNEPISEQEQVFKDKYVQIAIQKGSRKSLVTEWNNLNPIYKEYGHLTIAIGVDLAISKSEKADNSAIAVWGTNGRDRILLYADYGKWSPDEIKQKVIENYHAFKPLRINVENVAFQDMLRRQLAEDIPVEGFKTTAVRKFNPETGLASMAMLFEQEKVIIPSARHNADYYNRIKQLVYEMGIYSYDSHAGDLLMASWFALEFLNDFDRKMKQDRGFFAKDAMAEQIRRIKPAMRILIIGYKPPIYRIANNGLVYIFRNINMETRELFFTADEPFMIFATKEQKSIAYIINKATSEIVGRIEGDISPLFFTALLERSGYFFNNAQLVIERTGEGDAIYLELLKRNYPKLLCLQPDQNGYPTVAGGFRISPSNLPIAVDYFKQAVDGLHIDIPDDWLLNEMGEVLGVEGSKMIMSFGSGQRVKTAASALWLLDNYENQEKKLYNKGELKAKLKKKKLNLPYLVFR